MRLAAGLAIRTPFGVEWGAVRIGEILHRDGLVGAEDLAAALAEQAIARKRVASLLIIRGLVDPDVVARALAEQFGVSAALTKHLDNRDKALAKLLPANLARQHFALPIGRLRDGEIVLCVRDPKPHSQAAFERILNKPVLITVASAYALEPLIDETYAPVVTQDFGVRFARPSTQPMNVPQAPPAPQSFAAGTLRPSQVHAVVAADDDDFDIDMDEPAGMPEVFTVVSLDDAGVDKDFSPHFDTKTPTVLPPGVGAPARQSTLPPPDVTRTPAKK